MNQPSAPRAVQGPSSMPRIRSIVHHQLALARTSRRTMRPSRARAAAKAGAKPAPPRGRSCADAITGLSGPGELGRREPGLALVRYAEGVDLRAPRLGHRQVRPGGMEHAGEAHRLTRLDPERHDVLDLEVDRVADAHGVPQPIVADLDRRSLHADHLADERRQARHRTAKLAAENLA